MVSDFRTVPGFEEVWRPVALRRTPETVLRPGAPVDARSRLARLAARAPEVMVKVTGRTRSGGHLRAHLQYISRHGGLEVQDRYGQSLIGKREIDELAADWAALALSDWGRRPNSPITHSIVLSMPAGTDATVVRDAANAFAAEVFGARFDYVAVLHTDTKRPHVHLSVCSRGDMGERLNPKKSDLEHWRQGFAQALRDRGVEAEATPRRARGVARKPERMALRKIRDRHEAGRGPVAKTVRSAYGEASKLAFGSEVQLTPWERRVLQRQAVIRNCYLVQAKVLQASSAPEDRELGSSLQAWVARMPTPESRRLALARELRAANRQLDRTPPGRDRGDKSR